MKRSAGSSRRASSSSAACRRRPTTCSSTHWSRTPRTAHCSAAARQALHRRIAEALEKRFPDVVETRPEIVALHYGEAVMADKAITYWHLAGKMSATKSAMREATAQLRRGLALVEALSDLREQAERELDLQMALGPALCATKISNHPDIGRTYARAWSFVGKSGIPPASSRRSAA